MKYLLMAVFIAVLSGCFSRPKVITGLEGKQVPSFNLLMSDSTTVFNTSAIKEGKPAVLFFFGPYCPYSRAQMTEIIGNITTLKGIQFYIFTNSSFADMKVFYNLYPFGKYSNLTVGVDYADFFGPYFKAPGVPYLAVYDSHRLLKQVLVGNTSVAEIKSIVAD